MELRLVSASAADAPLIQNLMQLYTHDFSEFWAGTDRGDLGADGRFPDYPLDAYWTEPGRRAWLIEVDGALAGFALVNHVAHSGRPVDQSVAEFFVARKYRGQGVGQLAAWRLFETAAGQWEAAVARRNLPALAFWRRAVMAFPGARDIEAFDVETDAWNGPILRFRTG